MNRENENFDQLRRLLKLKRYEQPPPRYFNDFSAQVVARLRADPSATLGGNWLQRVWGAFELKPMLPAVFGAAICGLLVAGAFYIEGNPGAVIGHEPAAGEQVFGGVGQRFVPVAAVTLNHASDIGLGGFSTNPVSASSLFDQIPLGMQPRMHVAHPLFK